MQKVSIPMLPAKKELEQDTTILWDIYFQKDEFLGYMAEFGRKSYRYRVGCCQQKNSPVPLIFSFTSIRNVESIQFDGEYYYYTSMNKDSVGFTKRHPD
jgi:hypothetical protein